MDLIAVGDVMIDVHVASPALARGGDVHGTVRLQPAGTSANAAVWAVWDGGSAGVVSKVGDDLAGRLVVEALAERGVGGGIHRDPQAPTGTMLVVVEAGERSMVADRGAHAWFVPAELPTDLMAGSVLVSGYLLLQDPTTETGLAAIERARSPYVAVEASSWPLVEAFGADRFLEETVAAGATAVLANEREATTLTGAGPVEAARLLGERFRLACVKRGADGAVLCLDGDVHEALADPVDEVDATGAGDAFDGVLLSGLARGFAPEEALRRACRAGALVAGAADTWPETR